MNEKDLEGITCKTPCKDAGEYPVCYSPNPELCNIHEGRAVQYRDGSYVKKGDKKK